MKDVNRFEVVQLHPTYTDATYAGCLGVVETIHSWGCVVRVKGPSRGYSHYRARWDEIVQLDHSNRPKFVKIENGEPYVEFKDAT